MIGRKRGAEGAGYRAVCYRCYRPQSSCMCGHVVPLQTQSKFVILMHSKEFRKIKNGTGILSHLSLPNSELFVGIDFSDNARINAIVEDESNNCFILYPSKDSLLLNESSLEESGKTTVFFLIDSTWACAKKIMRVSQNIKDLPRVSFYHDRCSAFAIKEQPHERCLSTIESIHTVLALLEDQGQEHFEKERFSKFLSPFHEMVAYQLRYTKEKR